MGYGRARSKLLNWSERHGALKVVVAGSGQLEQDLGDGVWVVLGRGHEFRQAEPWLGAALPGGRLARPRLTRPHLALTVEQRLPRSPGGIEVCRSDAVAHDHKAITLQRLRVALHRHRSHQQHAGRPA